MEERDGLVLHTEGVEHRHRLTELVVAPRDRGVVPAT